MIKINDYATKNHLNEWEIKDLPESDVYRLDLPNGDLSILFFLLESCIDNDKYFDNIFIPSFPTSAIETLEGVGECISSYGGGSCEFAVLDTEYDKESPHIKNITPDWSKYIAKDHAVLFLNKEDANRYSNISYENFTKIIYENDTFSMQDDSLGYVKNDNVLEWNKKISIILPSIHSQNIQEISNIAKDFKENYGVEYIEVVPTNCYLNNLYTEYRISFYRNIDFTKYGDVNTDISMIMKNIENDLDRYLYVYNFTEAEEALSNYEEFQEDSLESMLREEGIKMTYRADFSIIPNDTKVIIMNDIKESLIKFRSDNKNEYKQIKEYFNISSEISFYDKKNIDKIITTDSTGVLKVQDTKHLQVIDCEEFFTNFLQNDKS